ncbi:FecR domain-containing protein [Sphingobacterium sp. DN00404]|uniref:FecR domain-containing protein n=1 Tax=Sphingobacterium micropteri TaxID=2763501 RepID=A0ABR7YQW3_9SPHI|nr:FecR domain-containing protein [Sphingobacterium micropteri]MBD1433717.1 FecR domain-containing protein [Sphingobacterium micropteri]
MKRIDQTVLQWKRYFINPTRDRATEIDINTFVEKHPSLKELLGEMENNDQFIEAIKLYNSLSQDDDHMANDPILTKILDRIQETTEIQPVNKMKWFSYALAGIAACAALVMGILWLQPSQPIKQPDTMELATNILPGKNGVRLSMSDGWNVELRSDEGGIITGDQLRYSDGSPLFDDGTQVNDAVMTLSVPRGNDFYVVLADGTKVWMNAESELCYPQTFAGENRVVQLTGEAYFEVAKDKSKPFIVETVNQRIEVLGTHFNVNAYPTERKSAVTLVEGRIAVSIEGQKERVLYPGQQALVTQKHLEVGDVNVDEYIAWKNDEFMFNEESLVEAANRIGRWYDLDIDVDPALKDIHLWGSVPRRENFGQVLKLIQLTNKNVKVEIEGRRVRFMK